MCVDANAGLRAQQRQRAREKDAVFAQEALKFYNKETQLARTQNRNVIGLSRDQADAYAGALAAIGKGRKQNERAAMAYFRQKGTVNEGNRSRRFGTATYQGYLAAQSEVESVLDNVLGRNLAYAQEGAKRKFQAAQARGREALGIPAAYGAPVMLSPSNRLGGALQIASQVAGIVSTVSGLPFFQNFGSPPLGPLGNPLSQFTSMYTGIPTNTFASASDIKLKENIEEVGVSPNGHKIYEFNYIGFTDRWRGAMAQDVVKKNPLAVDIRDGYLTVDYSKIDVNMELV